MNDECKGMFGKLFGHHFKSFIIKKGFKQSPCISFNVEGSDNVLKFMDSQRDVYEIRCKRCAQCLE